MGDDEVDPFTKPKLHTSAMEEGIWLDNLYKGELMPEPELKYVEYTEADAQLAEAELLNQWREANVNEPISTLEALEKARSKMTGRFTANNPPPSQPPNRMRAPNPRPNLRGNSQPLFNYSPAVQAFSPEYYESATTRWKRVSPADFEGALYQRGIVRVPDFDQPHDGATLAVMHLSNGDRLAIQLRAFDSNGGSQTLQSMTHSTKFLRGRLGLQTYQHHAGQVALDLYVDMPAGRHTIARTHTTIPDWVLGFYKEDR